MGLFLLALFLAFAIGGGAAAWRFLGVAAGFVLGCVGLVFAALLLAAVL